MHSLHVATALQPCIPFKMMTLTFSAVCQSHVRSEVLCRSRCKTVCMQLPMRPSVSKARPQGLRAAPARHVCKADKKSQEPPWQRQEGSGPGGSAETERKKQEPELTPQDKKGRRTAIITGFISIGFGVAYLLLVSLLDSRGSVLHPPPPEAYGL